MEAWVMSCPSSVIVPPEIFQTGQAVHQLGLTVASNTGKADDLTRANVKVDIAHRIFFMGAAGHRHALHAR